MTAPLDGVRVLDLSRLLPGPVCTLHLADLGADVVKVEDTGAGDYARSLGLAPTGDGSAGSDAPSAFFRMVNRNKRSLALDLKASAGRDAFLRLAQRADVIVESFRPGVVDRLGVGYAAVAALNRRIVYCSITGYGQTGPYRDRAGHDINYLGYAGVLDQTGISDGPVESAGGRSAGRRDERLDRDSRRAVRRVADRQRLARRCCDDRGLAGA